jgi:hypothetical protein
MLLLGRRTLGNLRMLARVQEAKDSA